MGKKNFKDRKRARIQRELNELYNLEEKTELNEAQCERICFLSGEMMKLNGIPLFDVKKGWERFQKYYLPKAEQFLKEHENIGIAEIEQFLEEIEKEREKEMKKKLYEIYKDVAKIWNFSVEEIQHIMNQPVDFLQSEEEQKFYQEIMPMKGEIPTNEEFLRFVIEVIQNK